MNLRTRIAAAFAATGTGLILLFTPAADATNTASPVTGQTRTAARFCARFPEFRPDSLRTECTAIAVRDERTIGNMTLPNGYAVVREAVSEARVEYPHSTTMRRMFLADYFSNI